MLETAQLHLEELKIKQMQIWYEDKYKYWNNGVSYEPLKLDDSTWNGNSFVSVNKRREVIGFIHYSVDRSSEAVYGLSIMNFSDDIITFGYDTRKAIDDIFTRFQFRKLNFDVVIGNPIEKTYDRLVRQYGGRIVGIKEKEVRLFDGELYDYKMYEIFREEYMKHKRR